MKHQVQISADHRDFEGFVESLKTQLKKIGVFIYDDPMFEGSDMVGIIASKFQLNNEEINADKTEFEAELREFTRKNNITTA